MQVSLTIRTFNIIYDMLKVLTEVNVPKLQRTCHSAEVSSTFAR